MARTPKFLTPQNQKLPSILAKNPENNRPTLFLLDSGKRNKHH